MAAGNEIESKFAVQSFDAIREGLAGMGGVRLSRCFEENVVLDTPDAALRRRDVLLRLRRDASGRVTLKLPSQASPEAGIKIRREVETEVGDLAALEAIFAHLGYTPFLRYEKVRETWRADGMLVCLDLLPFGRYVEIEGTAEGIPELACRLGFSMEQAMSDTYHALHQAYRRAQGLPPENSFVFPPETRRQLLFDLSSS